MIGIDNVIDGKFSLGEAGIELAKQSTSLSKNIWLARLHVLITVMSTVGRRCVMPVDLEQAIITKHVYRITCNQSLVNPYYLMNCLRGSKSVVDQINAAIRGVTRLGINGGILKTLEIPVPPLVEQTEIVRRVEALFALADQIEARYKKAKAHTDRLTQSILAKAFRGELVPQDPNDKPAEELLKQIHAEKQKVTSQKASQRSKGEQQ